MTDSLSVTRQPDGAFRASAQLAAHLQHVLVDLVALHLYGKQAHWNITGPNFRDLHLQLDELVEVAREASDTIAERMRALSARPDARPDTVAGQHTLGGLGDGSLVSGDAVGQVVGLIRRAVATVRLVHDDVDAEDPTTADLLHTLTHSLEKQAWLLAAETYAPAR